MDDAWVEITLTGRGGSLEYYEDKTCARFSWEFALPPGIALIFGPPERSWKDSYPWALHGAAEVYEFVGAEFVRQQAPGAGCVIDLEAGIIEVMAVSALRRGVDANGVALPPASRMKQTAFERFLAGIPALREQWADGNTYDLSTIAAMMPEERQQLVTLLTGRDITWREVEALAAIDSPAARLAVDAALEHHLSIDTRVAAAEAMHRQGRIADIEGFLARQIRLLNRPADGMQRLLRVSADHPGESVKQALLWASCNCTECAPHCAALLLDLTGAASEPFDQPVREMLARLDLHNSYFDREKAFGALCRLVHMELDDSLAN